MRATFESGTIVITSKTEVECLVKSLVGKGYYLAEELKEGNSTLITLLSNNSIKSMKEDYRNSKLSCLSE